MTAFQSNAFQNDAFQVTDAVVTPVVTPTTKAERITLSVLETMEDYGRELTLRQVDEGTYNYETGTVSGDSTTDYTFTGMLITYRDMDIDGTRIMATDRKCLCAASGFSPAPMIGDQVIASSVTYTIVNMKTYELQGYIFAYVFQLRVAS